MAGEDQKIEMKFSGESVLIESTSETGSSRLPVELGAAVKDMDIEINASFLSRVLRNMASGFEEITIAVTDEEGKFQVYYGRSNFFAISLFAKG